MKTTDAVIGQWSKVFEYYGLPPVTGKKHYKGKCPICGQKGKYRCDDKGGRGTFICVCNIGDGWKLLALTQKKDFKAQATEVDEIIGNTYAHQPESVQSSVNKDDRSLFR
ncbi:DNA primase, partial [Photorhabdus temperata]